MSIYKDSFNNTLPVNHQQKPGTRQSITTALVHGVLCITAIWISSLLTLDKTTKYTGSLLTTTITFGVLIFAIIFCYKRLGKIWKPGKIPLRQLVLAGIIFSIIVGLTGGLIHYLDATFMDPHYAENGLKASQAKWRENNYSKEAIVGQVELTDTFRTPWKWALSSAIFMITTTLFLFASVAGLNKVAK